MTPLNLPPAMQKDLLDIVAKALLLRAGDGVTLSDDELHVAASTACVIEEIDGGLVFRRERH